VACLASGPALADLVIVSESSTHPDYNHIEQVGHFVFTGLGDLAPPTNQASDYMVWGSHETGPKSSKLPDPPQPMPGGGASPNYPFADPPDYPTGKGYGTTTIADLQAQFAPYAPEPNQVIDDVAFFIAINETGSDKPIQIDKLEISIINHLTNLPFVTYTIDAPPPAPPNQVLLLNDVGNSGISEASYEFRVNSGLNLASYAPEEIVKFDIATSQLSDGAELVWGGSYLGVFREDASDFGDAPDDYKTYLLSNGARHQIGDHEWHGANRDGEPDGQPTEEATGDGGDEDGVIYDFANSEFVVSLSVADYLSSRYDKTSLPPDQHEYTNIYLDGWIDRNRDGDFLDADEHIASVMEDPSSWGQNTKVVHVPISDYKPSGLGNYIRWRLTYGAPATGPAGFSNYGEVEDYFLTPEPTTILLLGSGLVVLARRRRK
jgi:hypothetical protein